MADNILIVDDEPLIRKSLARAFQSKGYLTDEACNGVEALNLLRTKKYKAILLDVIMPEKNGYEVLQEYKDPARVFLISAFSGDDTNIGIILNDDRVVESISKPFDNVFDVVATVIGKD